MRSAWVENRSSRLAETEFVGAASLTNRLQLSFSLNLNGLARRFPLGDPFPDSGTLAIREATGFGVALQTVEDGGDGRGQVLVALSQFRKPPPQFIATLPNA